MNYAPDKEGVAFAHDSYEKFPVLQHACQEELEDPEGVTPHLFMADVARWVENEFKTNGASTELKRLLEYLESAYATQNESVDNVIKASFIEHVYDLKVHGDSITNHSGKKLRNKTELFQSFFKQK